MKRPDYATFALLNLETALLSLLLIATGCSSEEEKNRKISKENLQGEYIYRLHNDFLLSQAPPERALSEPYPWQQKMISKYPRITKDFFRCKGSMTHPPKVIEKNGEKVRYFDCGGIDRHGLPLREGKEFIYPILIELLNYLQIETEKKVVITCGHRCPDHHTYVDPTTFNKGYKHMIGAQVSFYVQGMEDRPEAIVALLIDFYKKHPRYKNIKEYEEFKRYNKPDTDVSTPPWMNKEIFVKLYKKNEGRDFDNRHSYPYIGIQVRFDRDLNETVQYSWEKAHQNYLRK